MRPRQERAARPAVPRTSVESGTKTLLSPLLCDVVPPEVEPGGHKDRPASLEPGLQDLQFPNPLGKLSDLDQFTFNPAQRPEDFLVGIHGYPPIALGADDRDRIAPVGVRVLDQSPRLQQ